MINLVVLKIMALYDIFIDESCHLEHDDSNVMTIGYVKAPNADLESIKDDLKKIKLKHNNIYEIKWNTVSNSRIPLYKELIDYFFSSQLQFRCIVVKYKNELDHEQFNQGSHDNFYYKLIYFLLNNQTVNPDNNEYRVFLDIKDTRGRDKIMKIKEVFENLHHGSSPFIHFQHIRSHEAVLLQLADLFIGAITYTARDLYNDKDSNEAKKRIIDYLETKSGYHLNEGTEPWETKFNIFDHQPKRKQE